MNESAAIAGGRADAGAGEAAYLALLGERVRKARARRGMTRKLLARDSGVSERYLAQLEGGQGNISIILLRQIAHAMGLWPEDLVREGGEPPVELSLLAEFLGRLGPAELAEARRLLTRRFGSAADRARGGRVALIGLRGAGKSTLGAALARHLGCPFVELDRLVEAEAGVTLSEIFALWGQPGFRRFERKCLDAVIRDHAQVVLATGGSLVSEPGTYECLLANCWTVWLRAAPEEHMGRVLEQGDVRPMADNNEAMDDLRRILAGREPLYTRADAVVDTSGKPVEASLAELIAAVDRRPSNA